MSSINERIKEVRTEKGLSQRSFAERIGITGPSVAHLESGTNNPSEQTVRAICNEFNINRTWLETGEGMMYEPPSDDDYAVINEALMLGSQNKIKLFRIIAEMPEPLLDEIVKYFQSKRKDLP